MSKPLFACDTPPKYDVYVEKRRAYDVYMRGCVHMKSSVNTDHSSFLSKLQCIICRRTFIELYGDNSTSYAVVLQCRVLVCLCVYVLLDIVIGKYTLSQMNLGGSPANSTSIHDIAQHQVFTTFLPLHCDHHFFLCPQCSHHFFTWHCTHHFLVHEGTSVVTTFLPLPPWPPLLTSPLQQHFFLCRYMI